MPIFGPEKQNPADVDILGTTEPEVVSRYVDRRIYAMHRYSELDMKPMSTLRRSDHLPDDAFRTLEPLSDFLIENGMFYWANIPIRLPGDKFLCLHVWRSEDETDLSDLDLMRMTLLMRYVLSIIALPAPPSIALKPDVLAFAAQHDLTKTEAEIVAALIDGHNPRSIAVQTNRTYGTVRWHVQNILQKCVIVSQRNLLSDFFQIYRS